MPQIDVLDRLVVGGPPGLLRPAVDPLSDAVSCLRGGSDTATIIVGDLDTVFNAGCSFGGPSANASKLVHKLITEEADAYLGAAPGMNFENKIVLAIAIRLAARRHVR